MVGGSSSVSSNLNSVYNSTSQALSDALTKLASGKKFQNAGDDLLGYIRAKNVEIDISGYQRVREDLTEAKMYTSAAVLSGSVIYEKLAKMKDLQTKYAGTADTDDQAEYEADFDSLKEEVTQVISNAKVDSTAVVAAAEVTAVDVDPDGTSLSVTFTAIADASALTIDAVGAAAAIQTQVDNSLTYLSEAKAFDNIVKQQSNLTDTIISSKQSVLTFITDIDEAEQMNKVIDLSIRQQASVSMMAQGNMLQSSLAKLYD